MIDLENETAVITGAASGLGKALAAEFHRQGCRLALIFPWTVTHRPEYHKVGEYG